MDVDLLVVGGGTAGLLAAQAAAGFGARTLLAERERTGGECLWTGCVPSKALLAAAAAAADARRAARLGVDVAGVVVDWPRVRAHVLAAITAIEPVDSPDALRAAGVEVALADATFTGPASARVGDREVRFRQAVVATGSAPLLPPGLDGAAVVTNETVWQLHDLPRRLVVVGAGSSGCEFAQAFARLGSEVVLVDTAERVLPREDPVASRLVREALERDGVRVRTGTAWERLDGEVLGGSVVLVTAGRVPRTGGLGCDAAGIVLDGRGAVVVDGHLRTSNPRVWAAGDVTGRPRHTHTAGVDGTTAAANAVLGLRRRVDPVQPRVTVTDPEVAATGLATGGPLPAGHRLLVQRHDGVDRAVAEGRTEGESRLVVDRRGRLVGATVVGPRAGEVLAELQLAVTRGLGVGDLVGSTHAYPTFADGPWNAAVADYRRSLAGPVTGRAVRGLASARGRWLDRARR